MDSSGMAPHDTTSPINGDEGDAPIEECGDMPMPGAMSQPPKQSDSVTMNVSMNGSGAGGIRDLMDILRNLDNTSDEEEFPDADDGMAVVSIGGDDDMDHDHDHSKHDDDGEDLFGGVGEEIKNAPDEMYANVDAITPTGNDIHSKGDEYKKVNGGGNPMRAESLIGQLQNLYKEVKSR